MQHRVTMQDIAERVQMSRATVSAVLGNKELCYASEKTKELIRETAREMGYTPNLLARGLKSGRSYTIGLLSSSAQHEVKQQEMVHLSNLLGERNYRLYVSYYKGEEPLLKNTCEDLMARGCDALVVSQSVGFEAARIVRKITENVVFIVKNPPVQANGNEVFFDYSIGISEAMNHLLELGHRDIRMLGAFWNGFEEDLRPITFKRELAKNQLCQEHAIETVNVIEEINADFMKAFLLRNPLCTAIICTNDLLAMKTIQACAELGIRIPQDLSVIGFDDISASRCSTPALTTIRQPLEQGAREICKLLMNMLEHEKQQVNRHLPARLVIRKSTAAPGVRKRVSNQPI